MPLSREYLFGIDLGYHLAKYEIVDCTGVATRFEDETEAMVRESAASERAAIIELIVSLPEPPQQADLPVAGEALMAFVINFYRRRSIRIHDGVMIGIATFRLSMVAAGLPRDLAKSSLLDILTITNLETFVALFVAQPIQSTAQAFRILQEHMRAFPSPE